MCKSELAREKPEGTALIQHARVILAFFASKLAPTEDQAMSWRISSSTRKCPG
ncbi:hypothetical protein SAMN05216202_5113 [Pseudomonas mucidolens]|uniref:Uncharacterized protein n=1 Tax=Pseudomonas mucidolens TaxID=46679 RepID=A0A1H2P196_9PSED|nr:hypothetical protein SAMN05216202_5113 [Pseudomonas mucidolens]SQH36897.1 Uncharacterised protein [Pseudomonas mucidolens]